MDPGALRPADRVTNQRSWWAVAILIVLLIADVGYRGHTLGYELKGTGGPSEPLDCDEAAYAYIGHRILAGDVMYRDLTENKPPLGYWIYTLGVALGGYNELAIRILPVPFVLATMCLLFWLGGKLGGPLRACVAAGLYIVLSTDPYLFGNGSNMEHFMNCFSVASLALLVRGWSDGGRWSLLAAGVALGAAALVKQVAILPIAVYAVFLLVRRRDDAGDDHRSVARRFGDVLFMSTGAALIMAAAAGVLVARGAGADAYEDIMRYGRALATDTLPEPQQPSTFLRWLTGNSDPAGRLPWPFGTTNYLVWWGTGSWPLWLAAVPSLAYLLVGRGASPSRRLVACWTIAQFIQVVLPGLYWQHYYLLPTPGIALVVAAATSDAISALIPGVGGKSKGPGRFVLNLLSSLFLIAAIAGTVLIQVRSYLLVPAQELTVRYKGGAQWVALRAMGMDLAKRSGVWSDPLLYIWGWQSPLHFYGRLDAPTRHFFVDNLLRDQAGRDHPLIKPRIAEIMRSLQQRPPALIFAGYPPFPELAAWLRVHYTPSRLVPSRGGLGLWVENSRYAAFESYKTPAAGSSSQ